VSSVALFVAHAKSFNALAAMCFQIQKGKWESGRVSGGVYSGDEQHMKLLDEAYRYIMSLRQVMLCLVLQNAQCVFAYTSIVPLRLCMYAMTSIHGSAR
jgi:gamma-glutamylcyclotransferase (GGCT)/AIG2-like uncharacterized protein YtfP